MEASNLPQTLEHNKFFLSLGATFAPRRPSCYPHRSKTEIIQRNKSYSFDAGTRSSFCDPYLPDDYKYLSTQDPSIGPEFDHLNLARCSFSEKPRRFLKRRPKITISCTRKELVEDKKHTKRDSVLSVISPGIRNDEKKVVGDGHKEQEAVMKESTSIYSEKSSLSAKSTTIYSPPTRTFSETSKDNSMKLSRSSLNSSFSSSTRSHKDACMQDFMGKTVTSPERFYEQLPWHSEEDVDKPICYSSEQTSSFQEQEYRIAKAWLESEELRKAKSLMDGGIAGSNLMCASSCKSQPWTIDIHSSNYALVDKCASIKSPLLTGCFSNPSAYRDEDLLNDSTEKKNRDEEGKDDYQADMRAIDPRELVENTEKKGNRKRLSAISSISHGMRGWLSRRALSH